MKADKQFAQQRNNSRERVLPDDQVEKMWKSVQKNIGKFQGLFRNRMTVIDNSTDADINTSTLKAYKNIQQWAKKPPENSLAVKWINGQKK